MEKRPTPPDLQDLIREFSACNSSSSIMLSKAMSQWRDDNFGTRTLGEMRRALSSSERAHQCTHVHIPAPIPVVCSPLPVPVQAPVLGPAPMLIPKGPIMMDLKKGGPSMGQWSTWSGAFCVSPVELTTTAAVAVERQFVGIQTSLMNQVLYITALNPSITLFKYATIMMETQPEDPGFSNAKHLAVAIFDYIKERNPQEFE